MRTIPLEHSVTAEALNLWVLPLPPSWDVSSGTFHFTRILVLRYWLIEFSFLFIIEAPTPILITYCLSVKQSLFPSILHSNHYKFSPS